MVKQKVKAKDRRKAQKEHQQTEKYLRGRGEYIPVQKGYKRMKMKFV